MTYLPGQKNLLHESMRYFGICSDFLADYLQGNVIAMKQMICRFIDLTHAALGDEADNEKAAGNHIASFEAWTRARLVLTSDARGGDAGAFAKFKERLPKETAGALILSQEFLDQVL